jgi:replication initiation and membrane attachment protein DnaB
MELQEKIELNKKIRTYDGTNSFIISLQKQLKTNKFLKKEDFNGKLVKVLSEKQYESAKTTLYV